MMLAYTFTGWIIGAVLMLTNEEVRISDLLTQPSAWRCASSTFTTSSTSP